MNQQQSGKAHRLLPALLAFACFLMHMSGSLYYNAFGPEVPLMMDFFGRTESQIGLVLTVQAVGTLVASVFLALFGERYNKIHVVCAGLGTLSVCSVAIYLLSVLFPMGQARTAIGYLALLCIAFVGGVGFTGVDLMINGVINDVYPRTRATLLPIAHAFYGLGAMVIPLIVSRLVDPARPESFSTPYLVIGLVAAAVVVLMLVTGNLYRSETPYADMQALRQRVSENPAEIFREGRSWLFLLAFSLNFMLLSGVSAWLVTYAQRALAFDYASASVLMTLFFGGALVMRFASPLIFRFMPIRRYVVLMPVLAAVTLGVGFAIGNASLLYVLLPLGGFFQGGLIGAMMLICCDAFPERSASAASLASFAIGISTMTTPAIMGAIAERFGFSIPMLGICVSMLLSAPMMWLAMREPGNRKE